MSKSHKLLVITLSVLALVVITGTLVFHLIAERSHLSRITYHTPVVKATASNTQKKLPVLAPPPSTTEAPAHDYTIPAVVNGVVPVINRIPTTEKVAFLTIDDGIVTNPSDAQLMQAVDVKATFFLVYRFIHTDYTFFNDLAARTGSDIQNHTFDHYLLTNLTYDQQKLDICKNADTFSTWFGKRPVLLRPSGGAYNNTTLHAAADCGMKALIMWDATINNGIIKYQHGTTMQPGDIVLMHFRSTFQEDLNAFAQAAHDSGLQPRLLVNYL